MKTLFNKKMPTHPILLGIYPALALYFFNRHEIVFPATQKMFFSTLIFSLLIFFCCLLIFRFLEKAAISSSLMFFFFYSYGHFYDVLRHLDGFLSTLGRHRVLFPLWGILIVMSLLAIKRIKRYKDLNDSLNIVSIFLVGIIVIQLVFYISQVTLNSSRIPKHVVNQNQPALADAVKRDVYYIVVDAYSREDLLHDELDLDITEFIRELQDLGFYIPSCAHSNYGSTLLSMTSSLNMNYLDALGVDYGEDRTKLNPYFQNNLVIQKFESLDYKIATFKSLNPTLDIKDVDYYHDYFSNTSMFSSHAGLNFQYLFLKTTLLRPLVELVEGMDEDAPYAFIADSLPIKRAIDDRSLRQYEQSVFALDSLKKIPELSGNIFVYAHIYVTHQPYVFYPDGRFHPDLLQGPLAYRDQVLFMNQQLLDIVKSILEDSTNPPVIVIQSDHSYFTGEDRVKILNAYYFPDGGDKSLYDSITPVNTFRLIFDIYFGEENGLLSDISRYKNSENKLQETPLTCVKGNP